jgi:hypothetical protein
MRVAICRGWILGLLLVSGLVAAAPPAPEKGAHVPAAANLCAPTPPCGDHCSNVPYKKTECWTTVYGPAANDVVISPSGNPMKSTNMLLCDPGPYALCFYSGPPDATGKSGNKKLPCVMNQDGTVGNCSCQYYSSSISFVDMNGILNENAYYETAQQCGHDGAGCANMQACGSGTGVTTTSCGMQEAKVCGYLRSQNRTQPEKSLVPGYDVISDFSMQMASSYNMTKTTNCNGAYLGCMTAGCKFTSGSAPKDGDIVQCDCPAAKGPFQIGQTGSDITCDIASSDGNSYLWSAALTEMHGNPKANHESKDAK